MISLNKLICGKIPCSKEPISVVVSWSRCYEILCQFFSCDIWRTAQHNGQDTVNEEYPNTHRPDSRIRSVHGRCGMIEGMYWLIIDCWSRFYLHIHTYIFYLLVLITFINIVISSLWPTLLPVANFLGEKLDFAAAYTTSPRPGIIERAPILTPKTRFCGSFKTLHMYMSRYVHARYRSQFPTDFVLFGISVIYGLLQMENHSLVSKTTDFRLIFLLWSVMNL